jgi:outer membrane protein TolC
MVMAHLRENHAVLHLQSIKTQNNPVLSAFASGGWKNGYIPDINVLTANFTAGLDLRIPIFDATRHKNNLRLVSSEINITRQETDRTAREISMEVYQNEANLQAALRKIEQSELQVQQAEEALQLAEVNYSIGAITNLDLLDAQTLLAESKIMLLKARVDSAISIVRLDISVGRAIN